MLAEENSCGCKLAHQNPESGQQSTKAPPREEVDKGGSGLTAWRFGAGVFESN